MPRAGQFDADCEPSVIEHEDEKALAAIDEGIRDAQADRTIQLKNSVGF
jgi:hypothetical protein